MGTNIVAVARQNTSTPSRSGGCFVALGVPRSQLIEFVSTLEWVEFIHLWAGPEGTPTSIDWPGLARVAKLIELARKQSLHNN